MEYFGVNRFPKRTSVITIRSRRLQPKILQLPNTISIQFGIRPENVFDF